MMKKYVCVKSFWIDAYDDDGSWMEEETEIDVGKVFEMCDTSFRCVGGDDTVRLISDDGTWLEILPEHLEEYFKENTDE